MIKKPFYLKNKDLYIYGTDIPKTTFVSLNYYISEFFNIFCLQSQLS